MVSEWELEGDWVGRGEGVGRAWEWGGNWSLCGSGHEWVWCACVYLSIN